METVLVARHAMATRFEVLLQGGNPVSLRSAGESALDEVERLEAQLSLYRPTSEIALVNRHVAERPVRITPPVFRLLQQAGELSRLTGGAFDITVAPLVRCWGFMGGSGAMPDPAALAEARACVGMHLVELDPASFTVRFKRQGVMLDLGAIGKGYAIDIAAECLIEAGVTSAFLHGGTSSIYAIGVPPDAPSWKAGIPRPAGFNPAALDIDDRSVLTMVPLSNESLSISAGWGKSFDDGGKKYGHVLDPRLGEPVQRGLLAAVVLPSATETDALSTALLTLGAEGFDRVCGLRSGTRALLLSSAGDSGRIECLTRGISVAG